MLVNWKSSQKKFLGTFPHKQELQLMTQRGTSISLWNWRRREQRQYRRAGWRRIHWTDETKQNMNGLRKNYMTVVLRCQKQQFESLQHAGFNFKQWELYSITYPIWVQVKPWWRSDRSCMLKSWRHNMLSKTRKKHNMVNSFTTVCCQTLILL